MAAATPATASQLSAACTSSGLPTPHPAFLTSILSNTQRNPPLAALLATTKHRLLSSPFTAPNILAPNTPSFPSAINNVKLSTLLLSQDIPVQVLDILDIGRSKWEQIEALEAERKGETTKGREVIRIVPDSALEAEPSSAATQPSSTANTGTAQTSKGPFKLLLQDHVGLTVSGFEFKPVDKLSGIAIGCKLMLKKGTRVARGLVLLEPERCVVLGGRVEAWDKPWREGREERLRKEVGEERRDR